MTWLRKAFEQGFIAVAVWFCTSPLLIYCFLYGKIVFLGWLSLGLIVFVLGGFLNYDYGDNDDCPNYQL